MQTIAIGRFDDQIISGRRRNRVANDRLIVFAQVTGEKHAARLIFAVDVNQYLAGTQDVAGDAELGFDILEQVNGRAGVRDYLQQFQRLASVLFGVERQRRQVLRDLVPIAKVGFFFL